MKKAQKHSPRKVREESFKTRSSGKIGNKASESAPRKESDLWDTALVGVLYQNPVKPNWGTVALDNWDLTYGNRIHIPESGLNGAPFGLKVVVEPLGRGEKSQYGKIVQVLGNPESSDVGIEAIMAHYRLSGNFPQEVLDQMQSLPLELTEAQIRAALEAGREDRRQSHCMTIDGLDAKDLDDAVEIEKTAGGYRLWVHIADVTDLVPVDSPLDQEARQRGNSVYLVDRVLPMYPPGLSNGLCSLNPNCDRFCLSACIDFDERGNELRSTVQETVIRSAVRTSYEEVQSFFNSEDGILSPSDFPQVERPYWFKQDLRLMRELAALLRQRRFERGMLNFDFPETVVKLDENRVPVSIAPRQSDESQGLIEAFMIAANEAVARFCEKHRLPALYRVHEDPDEDKLNQVALIAKRLGQSIKIPESPTPKDIQGVLDELQRNDRTKALSTLVLRAMAKARYDTEDLGHFGLASIAYCHFTAPIRRYSDDCVHRAVKSVLHGHRMRKNAKGTKQVAQHVSLTERVAERAERETVMQKACEYYENKLGEVYAGIIAGLAPHGFYVQLPTSVEGTVLFSSQPHTYFQYDPDWMEVVNRKSGRIYRLGDPVAVRVVSVNVEKRFLNLDFVGTGRREKEAGGTPEVRSPQKVGKGKRKGSPSQKKKPIRRGRFR